MNTKCRRLTLCCVISQIEQLTCLSFRLVRHIGHTADSAPVIQRWDLSTDYFQRLADMNDGLIIFIQKSVIQLFGLRRMEKDGVEQNTSLYFHLCS